MWRALGTAVLIASFATPAWAQPYPSRAIKLVVPYATGGGVDIVARAVADGVRKPLGQPIVVENRPGAGGNVAFAYVAKSEPDGYTLLMGANAIVFNKFLYTTLPYDPNELVPIALVGTVPMVLLATPSVPAASAREAIALMKARPGTINFGSGGRGTAEHLAYELLKSRTGVDAVHVPYRGGSSVLTDLIGGQVQMMFTNQLAGMPYIKSGQLKALGLTGAERSPQLPQLPTLIEQGVPDFVVAVWWGVLGTAAIPKPVVAQINQAVNAALASPELKARLESLGAQPHPGSPEQFADFLAKESSRWGSVIQAAKITAE
jgi:tripartite-type tricarboxylate transporter receptor subunit TctC